MSRILLVDDDPDILKLNRLILECEGFSVESFHTPDLALESAGRVSYNVAVIDFVLPRMYGDKLALKLRNLQPHIGIIVLSGYMDSIKTMKALGLERCSIILKPVLPQKLIDEIGSMISIPLIALAR
jgi:DNA-binding response OmpR family regulator